ncbi:MAG: hypothetical protein ACTHOE_06670 [Conexibacter sp.]
MFRIPRRRPSAAMIVACCALFVALGGTSFALAVGSVGSVQIRDDSIRSIDVHNHSLRGHDIAPDSLGGGAIKEETLDTSKLDASHIGVVPQARTALEVQKDGLSLQVFVAADGGRSNARGVTSVQKTGTGRYEVFFDRGVDQCVYAATLSGFVNANPGMAGTGEISAQSQGGAVLVQTANSDGRQADRDFHLIVSC